VCDLFGAYKIDIKCCASVSDLKVPAGCQLNLTSQFYTKSCADNHMYQHTEYYNSMKTISVNG
jgi:hypothetical protein